MSFDHRASIVSFIEGTADRLEQDDQREWASRYRSLASSIAGGLDMKPGEGDVASPLHAIAAAVAKLTMIGMTEILGKSQRHLVLPSRYATIWIANRRLGWSIDRLTREFGYSDSSSTKHAIARANELRESDSLYRAMCDDLAAQEYACENCGYALVNTPLMA